MSLLSLVGGPNLVLMSKKLRPRENKERGQKRSTHTHIDRKCLSSAFPIRVSGARSTGPHVSLRNTE